MIGVGRVSPCLLAGLVAVAAYGCEEGAAPEPAPVVVLPGGRAPLDALGRRFGRLRERVRKRGYREEAGPVRLFVLEEGGAALPIDVPTARCTTFVALGSGGMNELTLTLYDGEGDETAVDDVEGEGGLVHVCPKRPLTGALLAPHHLTVDASEGAGAVMLAAFASEVGAGEGFAGLFEGILAPRVPVGAVEAHLQKSKQALRVRGFTALGNAVIETIPEGGAVRTVIELEGNRCYAVVARGSDEVRDVDIFVYDSAGAEVARDLAEGADPSVEHCTQVGGSFTFEARAFAGAGTVGLLVLDAPNERARQERADAPLPSTADRARRTSDSHATDAAAAHALELLFGNLRERGYASAEIVARNADLATSEAQTREIVIGPGCAFVVAGALDDGVDLDLYLFDAAARTLDRDTGVQATARVGACFAQATAVRATVKSYGREGSYALAVVRAPTTIREIIALRMEEATAQLVGRGYSPRRSTTARLAQDERSGGALIVPAGRCVGVAVAGDLGVEDVDVFIRDARGQLLVSESGPAPYAATSRCAGEVGETLSYEIAMYRGAGEVRVTELEGASTAPSSTQR